MENVIGTPLDTVKSLYELNKASLQDTISFVQNNTPIGRMLSFGEGPVDAAKNAIIHQKESLVSAIANNTPNGRMYVHDENFLTAVKNAAELKPVEHSVPSIPYEGTNALNKVRVSNASLIGLVSSLF